MLIINNLLHFGVFISCIEPCNNYWKKITDIDDLVRSYVEEYVLSLWG